MDNMPRLSRAIALAASGHDGQPSKDGLPYIMHPLTLMFRLLKKGAGESVLIVAVLHDYLEDCEPEVGDLAFLTHEERYAIECLTKLKGTKQTDDEYMAKLMTSRLAMETKVEDFIHNLDGARMPFPYVQKDMDRHNKYRRNLERLRVALGRVPAGVTA